MSSAGYPPRAAEPHVVEYFVRVEGGNGANPTKVEGGRGITPTRSSEGVYKWTFTDNPFTFVGAFASLAADTPGDVKQHTVTWDTWDASTKSIECTLWDSGGTADDLLDNEYMMVRFVFKRAGVDG
jgi:hypothetical protein